VFWGTFGFCSFLPSKKFEDCMLKPFLLNLFLGDLAISRRISQFKAKEKSLKMLLQEFLTK
jgi:hypothetical protein